MKVREYILLCALLAAPVFADDLDLEGVPFNEHPACASYVAAAFRSQGSFFRQLARQMEHSGSEADIYISRHAHHKFLSRELGNSFNEFKALVPVLFYSQARLERITQKRRPIDPKPFAINLYRRAGRTIPFGENLTLSVLYPFSFTTLAVRPPIGEYEVLQLKTLLFLRRLVAFHHADIAEQFMYLPMVETKDLTVDDLRMAHFHAGENARGFLAKRASEEMRDEIQHFWSVLLRKRVDIDELAKQLMKDETVPVLVREEIALRLAFERFYRVPRTFALSIFIGWVHRYFKDPQVEP